MTEYITPERIANAITMNKDSVKYYLLTEGKKDTCLFRKFINKDSIEVKTTFGCTNLVECIKILKSRGFERFVGIIDSDFHRILRTEPEIDNLFIVDYHDIEIMMIKSDALNHIINIADCSDKVSEFEESKKNSLLNLLLNSAQNIGSLRLANIVHNLGLKFKPDKIEGNQIPYKDFINDDLSVKGHEIMIKRIIDYSRNKNPNLKSEIEITEKFIDINQKKYDIYQLVNGHDITNILSLFFLKKIRCKKNMVADHNAILDSLILAYDISEFKNTDLYNHLYDWSIKNQVAFFA